MSLRVVLKTPWKRPGRMFKNGDFNPQTKHDARGEPIIAELLEPTNSSATKEFNLILGGTLAISMIFLFLSAVFGDALVNMVAEDEEALGVRVPVWERYTLPYETDGDFGVALEVGPYALLPTENEWNSTHHFVEYTLPIEEGGAAPNGLISLAVWLPDVPDGMQVPVIAESGPYFQEASVETPSIEVPGSWLGQMFIDQILPHGYAFAQISVSGTGRSNHCMDLMGNAEQLGNDAAVRWLAEQPWSNGAVALIGKSYDGSTPWQAAMFGAEHDYLKTIVPISGLIGVKELMWKNGSSEARAPIMHNGVYGSYGIDGDEEDYQNLCPDYIIGPGTGVSAYMFGSKLPEITGQNAISLTESLRITRGASTSFRACTIGTLTRTWPCRPSIASLMQVLRPGACLASGITITPTAQCNLTTVRTSVAEVARPSLK